jgi:hypothetical protein
VKSGRLKRVAHARQQCICTWVPTSRALEQHAHCRDSMLGTPSKCGCKLKCVARRIAAQRPYPHHPTAPPLHHPTTLTTHHLPPYHPNNPSISTHHYCSITLTTHHLPPYHPNNPSISTHHYCSITLTTHHLPPYHPNNPSISTHHYCSIALRSRGCTEWLAQVGWQV